MKKQISILILLVIIIYGCDEISKLTHFNQEYDQTVEIPAIAGIDVPLEIKTPNIESNSESSFSVNNTHKNLIENVELTEMIMTVSTPSDGDFSFIKSIYIYISAENLDQIKIAWKEDISDTIGNILELETSDTDLQNYIKKDSFDLKFTTITDEIISTDYSIDIHSVFFVDAKILGL